MTWPRGLPRAACRSPRGAGADRSALQAAAEADVDGPILVDCAGRADTNPLLAVGHPRCPPLAGPADRGEAVVRSRVLSLANFVRNTHEAERGGCQLLKFRKDRP